jgi:hypothetical protein
MYTSDYTRHMGEMHFVLVCTDDQSFCVMKLSGTFHWQGSNYVPSRLPEKPLELWAYEVGSSFELDLYLRPLISFGVIIAIFFLSSCS